MIYPAGIISVNGGIYHDVPLTQAEQKRMRIVRIFRGCLPRHAFTEVFDDALPFSDGLSSERSFAVDTRLPHLNQWSGRFTLLLRGVWGSAAVSLFLHNSLGQC